MHTTPAAVARPPFIDQSVHMLLAALLWAALGKHKSASMFVNASCLTIYQ